MDRYGCFACHGVRGTGRLSFGGAAALFGAGEDRGGLASTAGWPEPARRRSELHDAGLPAQRAGDRRADALRPRPGRPGGSRPARPLGGRPSRPGDVANGKKLFAEVPLHLLPHGGGEGPGLGPRALEGRLGRRPRLAAGVRERSARLQSPHADAAVPLQRRGVARRRGVHGGRVSRLRRPEGHPRTAPRQPDPRGDRREDCSASTAALLPRSPGDARPPRSSGRTSTASATRRRPRSTSAGARTCRGRCTAWLAAKVEAPRSFAKGLKMPSYGFGAEDRRRSSPRSSRSGAQPVPEAYALPRRATPAPIPAGRVGELIDRYRCLSCHQIGDRGGDISTAPLTFEGSKVQRDWLVDYLVLSYSIRPILTERMPIFRMPREEAVQLADAIESSLRRPARSPRIRSRAGRRPTPIPSKGERLYVTLGCRGCHILGSTGRLLRSAADRQRRRG